MTSALEYTLGELTGGRVAREPTGATTTLLEAIDTAPPFLVLIAAISAIFAARRAVRAVRD